MEESWDFNRPPRPRPGSLCESVFKRDTVEEQDAVDATLKFLEVYKLFFCPNCPTEVVGYRHRKNGDTESWSCKNHLLDPVVIPPRIPPLFLDGDFEELDEVGATTPEADKAADYVENEEQPTAPDKPEPLAESADELLIDLYSSPEPTLVEAESEELLIDLRSLEIDVPETAAVCSSSTMEDKREDMMTQKETKKEALNSLAEDNTKTVPRPILRLRANRFSKKAAPQPNAANIGQPATFTEASCKPQDSATKEQDYGKGLRKRTAFQNDPLSSTAASKTFRPLSTHFIPLFPIPIQRPLISIRTPPAPSLPTSPSKLEGAKMIPPLTPSSLPVTTKQTDEQQERSAASLLNLLKSAKPESDTPSAPASISVPKNNWLNMSYSSRLKSGAVVKLVFSYSMNRYQVVAFMDEPRIYRVQEMIQSHMDSTPHHTYLSLGRKPLQNEIVLAYYYRDLNWYRARVIGVGDAECTLIFIDLGDITTNRFHDIREITDQLINIPALSLTLELKGVPQETPVLKSTRAFNLSGMWFTLNVDPAYLPLKPTTDLKVEGVLVNSKGEAMNEKVIKLVSAEMTE